MVKDVAQSMIDQGLQKAGYYMVNLDDCWEATARDPKTGAMRADPDRFPSGTLKELADWLHERNFSFGIYTSAGNNACSSGGRSVPNCTTCGVPGSFKHYEQDALTYASWNIDYVRTPL
jgi:alpha-galactosidase